MSHHNTPTWFEVARRPKWIGALAIALAVAAICGLLAQWQGARSFEAGLPKISSLRTHTLNSVLAPNRAAGLNAVGTKVAVELTVNTKQCNVITGRVQKNGEPGNWVVCRAETRVHSAATIPIALGFSDSLSQAKSAAASLAAKPDFTDKFTGLLAPGEGPLPVGGGNNPVLGSLSVGQLANLYSPETAIDAYPLFLLVVNSAAPGLDRITVTTATEAQINWLSAFYALEWIVFCGFSVFLWWRLVRDAQLKEAAANAPAGQ